MSGCDIHFKSEFSPKLLEVDQGNCRAFHEH